VGIAERDFVRLKEEWLKHVMMIGGLTSSYRVNAYFVADALNWATMDCWMSHETLAAWAGCSPKTVQRSFALMEEHSVLAVYRRRGSAHPLRYAPVYLEQAAPSLVRHSGQSWPEQLDNGVHESFLSILPESSEEDGLPKGALERVSLQSQVSFKLGERGGLESELARVLGSFDVLLRLASIHDHIITRLAEALVKDQLGDRQIRAAKLAARQSQPGGPRDD
jgi:hypothetical protein